MKNEIKQYSTDIFSKDLIIEDLEKKLNAKISFINDQNVEIELLTNKTYKLEVGCFVVCFSWFDG